jgi:hypothetical protein
MFSLFSRLLLLEFYSRLQLGISASLLCYHLFYIRVHIHVYM